MTKKVLLVASYGGHWVQMRRVAQAFAGMDIRYASTSKGLAKEVAPSPLTVVKDANRDEKLALILLAMQMFWLMLRYRPHFCIVYWCCTWFFCIDVWQVVWR